MSVALPAPRLGPVAKYAALIRMGMLEWLAYRAVGFMRLLEFPFLVGIYSFLYHALYRSLPAGQLKVGGLDITETMTYVALVWIIDSTIQNRLDEDLGQQVREGQIAPYLARPMSLQGFFFCQHLGQFLYRIVLVGIPVTVVIGLFVTLTPPASTFHGLLFLVALIGAFGLSFSFNFIVGLTALYFESNDGIMVMKIALLRTLGGLVIPLSLLPAVVRQGFLLTPFPYLYYAPVQIYLGREPWPALWGLFAAQLAWLLAFLLIGAALERSARKLIQVQGG